MEGSNWSEGTKYYEIEACYFHKSCSKPAFKRAACWGKTKSEVQATYQRHLDTSGKHTDLREDQKEEAMQRVKIFEKWWTEEEPNAKQAAYNNWYNNTPAGS